VANPRAMLLKIIGLDLSSIAFYLLVPSIFELHDKRLASSASHPILYTIALHMSISSSVTQSGILQVLIERDITINRHLKPKEFRIGAINYIDIH
jgi:hypothetical protein